MRNSKTLEFMNNILNKSEKLEEKINKDNIEINKAIANSKLGKNMDKIKQAGYDIEYDGNYIKNPKTGKHIWPKDYTREEKKKVDFKGKLDSNRENIRTTRRFALDIEDNKIPKSARLNRNDYNSDEVEYYSPRYNDDPKKSISTTVNTYKKAVKDRDEARDDAERNKKSLGYYEKKVKDAQKELDWEKDYIKDKEKEADWAENKRKELIDKVRARKTSTVKEGAEPIAKGLKKKLKESEDGKESKIKELFNDIYNIYYNGGDTIGHKDKNYGNVELLQTKAKELSTLLPKEGKVLIRRLRDAKDNKGLYETYLKKLKDYIESNKEINESINSTLTEARQEEILSKLPKKKIEETDDTINESEENGPKVNEEGIKKELNEVSSAQAEFLYNQRKRKEYEKEQNEIRRADKISMLQTMINGLREHLWDLGLRYLPGNTVHKIYTKDDNKLYDSCTISESDLIEKLTKLEKFLRDAIDKRKAEIGNVNESEKQTLNEETVGEKITSPSGKFWVGDPCYVLSDDIYYGIWDDKYNFEDGIIDCGNGLSFLVHGTAYGDGSYQGTNGTEYGVDSGTLAIIPMDLIAKTDGVQFGSVETSKTAWLDYNDGNFDITLDNKAFTIETGDYEEDDEDWELDNDYDDQDNWDDEYRPGDDE